MVDEPSDAWCMAWRNALQEALSSAPLPLSFSMQEIAEGAPELSFSVEVRDNQVVDVRPGLHSEPDVTVYWTRIGDRWRESRVEGVPEKVLELRSLMTTRAYHVARGKALRAVARP